MHDLKSIKKIILVMSGKGGVGKSTFSVLLAQYLSKNKNKVGLLDLDLCGPSIGRMLSKQQQNNSVIKGPHEYPQIEWIPVKLNDYLCAISMSYFLENEDDAVIWRGPKKNSMIKEMVEKVAWDELDYLIVDTPPGTSDEHITLSEILYQQDNVGVILVTTPQRVATNDVRREITFCQKTSLKILGIVENMSFFVCPKCQFQNKLLCKNEVSGGLLLSSEFNLKLLGTLPYCHQICVYLDKGLNPFESMHNENSESRILNNCSHNQETNEYQVFSKHFESILNTVMI